LGKPIGIARLAIGKALNFQLLFLGPNSSNSYLQTFIITPFSGIFLPSSIFLIYTFFTLHKNGNFST